MLKKFYIKKKIKKLLLLKEILVQKQKVKLIH
jgi:hypothetical protein